MSDPAEPPNDAFWAGDASPQRYRRLLDAVGDGVYQLDADGRFVGVNDALAELTGFSREQLLGEPASVLFGAADRDRLEEGLAADDGLASVGVKTASGDAVPCEVRVSPGDDGHVGVVRQISDRDDTTAAPESATDREHSEGDLRDTAEQFQSLVGAVEEYAIFRLDPEGTVISWNEGAREIKGYDADEILGEHFSTFYTEADREAGVPERNLERASEHGSVDDEGWRVRADGSRFWATVTITAVRDDDGSHRGFLKVTRDMTDRHRRERELETELDHVLGRVSDAFYAVDEAFQFTHVNERAEQLLGHTAEELVGTPMWGVFPEGPESALYERFQRALERQKSVAFERHFASLDIWAEVNVYPSETGLSVYLRDVTERKERERELELFRNLLDQSTDAVFVNDPETGEILDVNETATRLLGYDREELLELTIPDIQTEFEDETEWASFVEDLRDAGQTSVNGFHRRKNGSTFPVDVEVSHVELDREYLLAIARDVSERRERERRLEESEQRYRTLAEYFPNGIVTLFDHDLRYELAAGQGFDRIPVDQSEVQGRHFREVWDEETAAALEPAFQAALDGEERSVELTYAGREWVLHAVPITDERGEVFAGMTMAQDITERKERERYLEDVKSRLEAAAAAGAVGAWEWQIQADQMIVDESFAEMFGVDPEAAREGVSLDRFIDAIHEDDRERVEAEIERAVDTCGEYEAEYRVQNADGEYRWVVARGQVECADGEPVQFHGALTDITDRKQAELELQQNNEQLEALFEVLPVGVVVAEADGELVSANDTAEEIWGGDVFDAGSIEEYEQFPIYWADSSERVPPEEMTMAQVLDGETVAEPHVYEIARETGERRIIEVKGRPIWNEHGEVVRGVITLSDVTERRETQRKLRESERRYRTLVESFPDGAVALFDDNLEYTAVGGELMDEVGVDVDDRVGNSVYEIYPDDLVDDVSPHFEAALDGKSTTFDAELYDRHFQATTLPVRDADGDIFAGMLVVQDVTERWEYQRALEASNERLEQFAYAASHDLQEPLRMVSSYLQLLESRYGDELDSDAEEFLDFAVDGAERMRAMIDGLLEYSRIETRGDPLEPTDLESVLADVRTDLQFRIDESDADVTADSLPTVRGDEDQLRQVFQNLLSNAIEYSGEERPQVHISAERDGRRWRIDVEDRGIGIDADDQTRIFEVFQRLHTHEDHEGTGIGLALCRRIVERHGGDIWVDSEPGEGATFSFTLPAVEE